MGKLAQAILSPFDRGTRFHDRVEAGRQLATCLMHLKDAAPVVLALPRGGVPVGYEVARALGAPLDLVLVRKIGAPDREEFGIGAVVDGADPQAVIDEDAIRELAVPAAYLDDAMRHLLREIERRRACYLRGRAPLAVRGRTVVVTDDGVATGGTVRAALQALRRQEPARLVLAVPVAPADTVGRLQTEVDELVCLATPEPFLAVGRHYDDFEPTGDEEVVALLEAAEAWAAAARAGKDSHMAHRHGSDEVAEGSGEAGAGQPVGAGSPDAKSA